MRRRGKIDSNQNEIVNALRMIPGVSVAITSGVGSGYPDINIGYKGKTFLVELKDGAKFASKKKLRPDQEKFKAGWTGSYSVCESLEDCLDLLNL